MLFDAQGNPIETGSLPIDKPGENDTPTVGNSHAAKQQTRPTSGEIFPSPHPGPTPQGSDETSRNWYRSFEGWKSRAELLAFLFAIAYAVVTFYQWRDAHQSGILNERAWVGPNAPVAVKNLDFRKARGEYILSIKNFGRTPALGLFSAYVIFANRENEVPGSQTVSCDTRMYDQDINGHRGRVLWPQEEIVRGPFPELPQNLWAKTQPKTIYVAGCIAYRDIFGGRHWTKFCYLTRHPEIQDQQFESCYRYNETDGN